MNEICACKGIRSCFLCEKQNTLPKEETSKTNGKVYVYCYKCQRAWLETTEQKTYCIDHINDKNKKIEDEHLQISKTESNHCDNIQGNNFDKTSKHPSNVERCNGECQGHNGASVEFPGIHIQCDFVSEREEEEICDEIYQTPFVLSQSGRRKQDYGPKVNFKRKKLKVSEFTGLPKYSKDIYQRMKSMDILSDFDPVEMCNLEYSEERGSAIDPHFDDFWLWGERLVTLNLLSDSILCFTNDDKPDMEIHVPLFRRSLLIVYGPARHTWKHSIHRTDIKDKRIAITFRELSDEFKEEGSRSDDGRNLLEIALTFEGKAIGVHV